MVQRITVQLADGDKDALERVARLNARSTSAEAAYRLRLSLQHDDLGGLLAFVSKEGKALAETGTAEVKQVRNAAMDAPSPVSPPVSASDKPKPARTAMCEHRVRPGAFCKRCDGSLASGAGGSVSAGLAGSSAPVASDGALAEPVVASSMNPETRRGIGAGTGLAAAAAAGPGRDDDQATSGERPGSANAPEPPPLSLPVFGAGGDLPPKPAKTPAELAASFPGVTTGGELDLRKSQVTPHLKQGQAGRKK